MSFTQQYVSLIFVVLLNAVTLFVIVSEYRRVPRDFLGAAAFAQLFALIWHLSTVWTVLVGVSAPALVVSSLSTWLFSLGFLAAILLVRGVPLGQRLALTVAAATAVMAGLAAAGVLPFSLQLWFCAALALLATPFLTLGAGMVGMRGALFIIQLSVAACFGAGFLLVILGHPEVGGTLYLVNALLIPAGVQIYFQHALRLSTDEMAERETRYRELFDSLLDAYYWLGEDAEVLTASPSIGQFGYTPEQLAGQSLESLFTEPENFREHLARTSRDGQASFEGSIRREDGRVSECQVSILKVTAPGPTRYSGTIRDVTERNQLERQFLDAQRRESLGVLAGGVAHDFNNILQGISSNAEFVMEGGLTPEQRDASLQAILSGTATASTQCNRLLQYTGEAQLKLQPVRIADTLVELVNMLRVGANDHSIGLDVADSDVLVDADETLVRQVMLNLLQNALDASVGGGQVSVAQKTASAVDAPLPDAVVFGEHAPEQEYLCMDVADTGCGMPPEVVARIFDPFYTTREQGHGLGLSAVLGIIKRHNGVISVQSTPGKGSRFRVALPVSNQVAPVVTPAAPAALAPDGQVILVVDDSAAIRGVIEKALVRQKYKVLLATDGAEALEVYREHQGEIALVFSDINMPNLDGFGLVRALRAFTDVPVVLTSGLYNSLDGCDEVDDASVDFLPKPYQHKQLFSRIQQSLQSAAERVPEPISNRGAAGGRER